MLGDNMAAVYRIDKCKGGEELRSGTLMRMLGYLDMRSGCYFRVNHVRGVANALGDGVSRWERDNVNRHIRKHRPDINRQEQDLGQTGRDLCTGILASCTSVGQLRTRLSENTCHRSGLGSNVEG